MINYYQPFLLPFLRAKQYRLPGTIRQTLFLSFEDALWALLSARDIPKGSTVLIPDFYCIDVVKNIRNHGYNVEFYPLNDTLRITSDKLDRYINKHSPAVLILFHACGIRMRTVSQIKAMTKMYPSLMIIEDAVHLLINPETITLVSDNHYLIDSLRKVSPLYGSFLYSTSSQMPIRPKNIHFEWKYYLSAVFWYIVFRVLLVSGMAAKNSGLVRFSHEKILKRHDDIIGDSMHGYAGIWVTQFLHKHLDFTKISRKKTEQILQYEQLASTLLTTHPSWYTLHIEHKGQMHVFPLAFRDKRAEIIRTKIQFALHKNHLPVWFKYPDSPWGKHRSALFLPLGFHIRPKDIHTIISTLASIDPRR